MTGLSPSAEREVLALLEEALDQPGDRRRQWLRQKLGEREEVGRHVERLLAFAERRGF